MSSSVNITNVYAMQPAFTQLGMGPIPTGTTLTKAVNMMNTMLSQKLQKGWPGSVAYGTQEDYGIMGPWSDNVAGSAPPCVVQQITGDFGVWELPVDTATINAIAQQITQEISSQGGIAGVFYGESPVGPNESIYWGVGYGTCAIGNASGGGPDESGVVYLFAAQLGLTSDVELYAPHAGVGVVDGRTRIIRATTGTADVAQKAVRLPGLVLKLGVEVGVTAQG